MLLLEEALISTFFFFKVSSNGVISFGDRFNRFEVAPFPTASVPLLAPLWADFSFRKRGTVSYRVAEDESTLTRVREIINFGFSPSLCVVVTWDEAHLYTHTQPVVSFN